jgi:hypothetical protein
MGILESWQHHNHKVHAVVKHSEEGRKDFVMKEYEAMWLDEAAADQADIFSFGGFVGHRRTDFDALEEAEDFLPKGIAIEVMNLDKWLEMVEV